MKFLNSKITSMIALTWASFVFIACSDSDNSSNNPQPAQQSTLNIVETAQDAGTVASLLNSANQTTLIDILTYHVFPGSVLSPAAIALDGQSVTMLNGSRVSIDLDSSGLILNFNGNRQAIVTVTDVLSSNGVIHVIDAVLDPADSP